MFGLEIILHKILKGKLLNINYLKKHSANDRFNNTLDSRVLIGTNSCALRNNNIEYSHVPTSVKSKENIGEGESIAAADDIRSPGGEKSSQDLVRQQGLGSNLLFISSLIFLKTFIRPMYN